MDYVIFAVLAVALVAAVVFTIKRNNAIKKNGIEADAVVSRIEENVSDDKDGGRDVSYTYYVKYQTKDGNTVEARLSSEPARAMVGTKLRIKYLPEKPKYVIPVK